MTTLFVLLAVWVAGTALPILYYNQGEKNKKRGKRALAGNLVTFAAVAVFASVFIFSGSAYAAEGTAGVSDFAAAMAFLGAGLVTGLSCVGTGIAVGSAASAAIGAISENEGIMGKALVFVAMAEGIAIYGLLVSFMLLGRV